MGQARKHDLVRPGRQGDTAVEHGVEERGVGPLVCATGVGVVDRLVVTEVQPDQGADDRAPGGETGAGQRVLQMGAEPPGPLLQRGVRVVVQQ